MYKMNKKLVLLTYFLAFASNIKARAHDQNLSLFGLKRDGSFFNAAQINQEFIKYIARLFGEEDLIYFETSPLNQSLNENKISLEQLIQQRAAHAAKANLEQLPVQSIQTMEEKSSNSSSSSISSDIENFTSNSPSPLLLPTEKENLMPQTGTNFERAANQNEEIVLKKEENADTQPGHHQNHQIIKDILKLHKQTLEDESIKQLIATCNLAALKYEKNKKEWEDCLKKLSQQEAHHKLEKLNNTLADNQKIADELFQQFAWKTLIPIIADENIQIISPFLYAVSNADLGMQTICYNALGYIDFTKPLSLNEETIINIFTIILNNDNENKKQLLNTFITKIEQAANLIKSLGSIDNLDIKSEHPIQPILELIEQNSIITQILEETNAIANNKNALIEFMNNYFEIYGFRIALTNQTENRNFEIIFLTKEQIEEIANHYEIKSSIYNQRKIEIEAKNFVIQMQKDRKKNLTERIRDSVKNKPIPSAIKRMQVFQPNNIWQKFNIDFQNIAKVSPNWIVAQNDDWFIKFLQAISKLKKDATTLEKEGTLLTQEKLFNLLYYIDFLQPIPGTKKIILEMITNSINIINADNLDETTLTNQLAKESKEENQRQALMELVKYKILSEGKTINKETNQIEDINSQELAKIKEEVTSEISIILND